MRNEITEPSVDLLSDLTVLKCDWFLRRSAKKMVTYLQNQGTKL